MFSTPFTTRPPRRSDWAGGPRGVVAVSLGALAIVAEVIALSLAASDPTAGTIVAIVAAGLLVPAASLACGFAGSWGGPARRWGIGVGILMVLPPLGVLWALLPLSFLHLIAVSVIGFAGHLLGRRRAPERRFD